MVGILLSFWESLFSGVMLVSGRVAYPHKKGLFEKEISFEPTTSFSGDMFVFGGVIIMILGLLRR